MNLPTREIVVASLLPPGKHSGSERFIANLIEGLNGKGIHTTIVNPKKSGKSLRFLLRGFGLLMKILHLRSAEFVWRLLSSVVLIRRNLKRELRGNNVVVVHAQDVFAAWACLRLRDQDSVKTILTAHFNESVPSEFAENGFIREGGFTFRWIADIERRAIEGVDCVVFVSEYLRRIVESKFQPKQSVVIHNGTSESYFQGLRDQAPKKKVLINIGSLEKRKSQEFLLAMLKKLLLVSDDFELWLVGSGPLLGALREQSARMGIEHAVRFRGKVDNVFPLLADSFLCVHSARRESFGLVLIEALSAGKPVISAPVGGIVEIVSHGRNGYLCPATEENIDEWVRLICSLVDDRETYDRMSREAKRSYSDHFTLDRMVNEYDHLYSRLCGEYPEMG